MIRNVIKPQCSKGSCCWYELAFSSALPFCVLYNWLDKFCCFQGLAIDTVDESGFCDKIY